MNNKQEKKKSNSFFITIIILLMMGTIAGLVTLIFNPSMIDDIRVKMATLDTEQYSEPYEIETFTAKDDYRSDFIRMSVVLGTKDKQTLESLENAQPPVKELLVRYVYTHPADVWSNPEKTENAKSEIIDILNENLNLNVGNIYITDIIKQ